MNTETMSRRLKLVGIASFLIGLGFGIAALPALNQPTMLFLDVLIWPINGPEFGEDPVARLMLAISGGAIAGFGGLWFAAAGQPCREAPNAVRTMLMSAAVTWFLVDSCGSLLAGVPLNVLANIPYLLLLLWPVWRGTARKPFEVA